jgi:hypothetical protein
MKLRDLVGSNPYKPKAKDEEDFINKHTGERFPNMYDNKQYDNMFKGTGTKFHDRPSHNHGTNPGGDEKIYSEYEPEGESIDEKNLLQKLETKRKIIGNINDRRDATPFTKKVTRERSSNMETMKKKGDYLFGKANEETELQEMAQSGDKVLTAFLNKKPAKGRSKGGGRHQDHTDGKSLFLHGNEIARHTEDGGIEATMAGWGSKTTRDRLNSLHREVNSGSGFYQKNHTQHYNGKPIDTDEWVTIKQGVPTAKSYADKLRAGLQKNSYEPEGKSIYESEWLDEKCSKKKKDKKMSSYMEQISSDSKLPSSYSNKPITNMGNKLDEMAQGMFRANLYGINNEAENDGKKYKIRRFYKKGGSKTIASGLTKSFAKSHCNHDETSSATATSKTAKAHTRKHGEWFDGWDKA